MKRLLSILTIFIILAIVFANICFADTGTLKNTDFLNMRESPSTSSNLLTVLPSDASFNIISDEGDWYQIQYQSYTGYVSKQYVTVSETNTNVNTDIPAESNSNGIVKSNSNIYVLPLVNSTVIGTVNSGTQVLIVSITGKWSFIQTDSFSGWIFTDNINGVEETNSNDHNQDNNSVNTETNIVDNNTSEKQDNTTDNENSDDDTSNEETNSNDSGNDTDTTEETSGNYPKTMYVNVEAVYIRAEATTSSEAVASIGLNTPVTVNGEEGDWYKVTVTDGSGYMMKQYLSETRQ